MRKAITIFALAALVTWAAVPAPAQIKETERVKNSIEVLDAIMSIPEKGIPPVLLRNAHAVAIIPHVVKLGFVIGGRHGKGVVMVRGEDGQWSSPSFISFTGGSVGWQIGAQAADIILVFKSSKGVEGMMKGKFTLGADASVAAGPVGRHVEAGTDVALKAEIYSYSRSRGLFAGVALEGSALRIDDDANAYFYGETGITAGEIFRGKGIEPPDVVMKLKEALDKYASEETGD